MKKNFKNIGVAMVFLSIIVINFAFTGDNWFTSGYGWSGMAAVAPPGGGSSSGGGSGNWRMSKTQQQCGPYSGDFQTICSRIIGAPAEDTCVTISEETPCPTCNSDGHTWGSNPVVGQECARCGNTYSSTPPPGSQTCTNHTWNNGGNQLISCTNTFPSGNSSVTCGALNPAYCGHANANNNGHNHYYIPDPNRPNKQMCLWCGTHFN